VTKANGTKKALQPIIVGQHSRIQILRDVYKKLNDMHAYASIENIETIPSFRQVLKNDIESLIDYIERLL